MELQVFLDKSVSSPIWSIVGSTNVDCCPKPGEQDSRLKTDPLGTTGGYVSPHLLHIKEHENIYMTTVDLVCLERMKKEIWGVKITLSQSLPSPSNPPKNRERSCQSWFLMQSASLGYPSFVG
jgi:hypothetical protein